MREENILANVQERYDADKLKTTLSSILRDLYSDRSKELFSALAAVREKPGVGEHILDVRGLGLMVGVEFASPTTVPHDIAYRKNAPKDMASRVTKKCIEKGMYLLTTSIYQVVSKHLLD